MTDIQIAQKNKMQPITQIAQKIGLKEDDLECYGKYKAKITMKKLKSLQQEATSSKAKLILVTAITPTPAGEGKSTVSIGLADGLCAIGKNAVIALREPSLGPCFGVKGGACGGGHSQIVPMEDINLHFTGDIHAITVANNLIASLIDNHIQQGNALEIDSRTIMWKRCVDLNDRALRNVVVGLGGTYHGVPREDHFCISVASEIMAIICLSKTIAELKQRIDNIVVALDINGDFVKFGRFKMTGAVAAVLKDAILPNLVQTLEKTPAFVHGGPFANIAHGCNSINATLCALATGDYVVTEAGFAADLGAQKFFDIKCRKMGIVPNAVVIVATIRALKMHGGASKAELEEENVSALKAGFENLKVHIENIKKYNLPVLVGVNKFATDTQDEIDCLLDLCRKNGATSVLCESHEKGAEGAKELAKAVVDMCENTTNKDFSLLYQDDISLFEKVETTAKQIYRAKSVSFSQKATKKLQRYTALGYGSFPVCVAKTQNSLSHDAKLLNAPKDYDFPIVDAMLYAGAGFVVVTAGDIMTMPGLPKEPAALKIDVDDEGIVSGLF